MKSQTLILLIIAGACGLVAMLGVKQYLDKQNQKEDVPKIEVLVAQAPIKAGERLNEMNTQFVTVEQATCPEGVVTDLEQIKERGSKVPRGVGDWILVDQLTEQGEAGIVGNIPDGMRVATIPVDATTHHSGMLQPGNRIDLLLTFQDKHPETGERLNRVIPLLEYIEVFAVDNVKYGVDQGGENAQARNISLLVNTNQMMKLQLAKKKGDISTVLRSTRDKDAIEGGGLSDESLTRRDGEVDERSTLDTMAESAFRLPDMGADDMFKNLQAETEGAGGGSGPVPAEEEEEMWVMAIYEGGSVRVEEVSEVSDIPIDTRDSATPRGTFQVPDGVPATGAGDLPDLEGLGLDNGIEDAASDLLDLLN